MDIKSEGCYGDWLISTLNSQWSLEIFLSPHSPSACSLCVLRNRSDTEPNAAYSFNSTCYLNFKKLMVFKKISQNLSMSVCWCKSCIHLKAFYAYFSGQKIKWVQTELCNWVIIRTATNDSFSIKFFWWLIRSKISTSCRFSNWNILCNIYFIKYLQYFIQY